MEQQEHLQTLREAEQQMHIQNQREDQERTLPELEGANECNNTSHFPRVWWGSPRPPPQIRGPGGSPRRTPMAWPRNRRRQQQAYPITKPNFNEVGKRSQER